MCLLHNGLMSETAYHKALKTGELVTVSASRPGERRFRQNKLVIGFLCVQRN